LTASPTPRRITGILLLALLGLTALAYCGTQIAPVVPPGLAPLPADLDQRVRTLVKAAEHYRGLKLEHPVPRGAIDVAGMKKAVAEDLSQDLPPARLAEVDAALKAFSLIPETMNLTTYLPDLLSSQTAGFYDAKRKYLAIASRKGGMLDHADGGDSPDGRMEDAVLVHELTHAIQDQHFDLEKLTSADPLLDLDLAESALAEGDATLTMFDFLAGTSVEDSPELARRATELLSHPPSDDSGSSQPGEKELAEAPAWFRETLLFSYTEGFAFCLAVRQHGGQPLLDYAFKTDPPRSSEQILHPDKWYGQRDDPIVIELPDLTTALLGYRRAALGEMGEEGIRILLREHLHDDKQADRAAAGWGGDRFAVYEKSGSQRLIGWVTDWDTETDANEFEQAAGKLGPGWEVSRTAAKRVVVLRGVDAPQRAEVVRQLAAAKAQAPPNKPVPPALLRPIAPNSSAEGRKTPSRGF
jgi:hypothetical protein